MNSIGKREREREEKSTPTFQSLIYFLFSNFFFTAYHAISDAKKNKNRFLKDQKMCAIERERNLSSQSVPQPSRKCCAHLSLSSSLL